MVREFLPCLPTLAPRPPTGDNWLYEIKHDGFRLIARREADAVRLVTKGRVDVTKRYTLVAEALGRLRVQSIVIDGEVCCDTFDELWNQENDGGACLMAFDLLELDGPISANGRSWSARPGSPSFSPSPSLGLHYVEHLTGDGATIFEHVCKLGLEGIVAKRADMQHQPGRSKRWLKVKNRAHPSIDRVREAFAYGNNRRA
jgi:bifunctional non-homologous end joining protein LigD